MADLETALAEALPELRRLQFKTWYWLLGLALGGFTLIWLLTDEFTRVHPLIFLMVPVFILFAIGCAFWLKERKERLLLPAIASAFGFSHQKNDENFFTGLPSQMLPRRGLRYRTDDSFTGEIAGQKVRFAEVLRAAKKPGEDQPKGEVPDFKGLVFEIALRGEVKPLMLADKHQTAPRITSEPVLDTGTAPLRDSFSYMRAEYGLWATSDERQSSRRDLLQGLVQLGPEVFENRAFLYSAAIRAGKLSVALSYRQDLFRLGGLFASKSSLMRDIRQSTAELTMVIRFATGALKLGQGLAGPAR